MEQTDVIELLDGLYSMIAEAWGVPLGNDKCIIEREKALDIINEIKAAMPSSLAEAKRLVAARDEFIGNAKKEAEALRKSSEEKAKAMVEEQEVIRVARRKSAEMISSAEAKSAELRRVAGGGKPAQLAGDDPDSPHGRADGQRREEAGRGPCCRQL